MSGIDAPADISVVDGEYSLDGGAFTSSPGSVLNGQTVRVRRVSSSEFATAVSATLTIGGVTGTFSVSTLGADTTPDAFSFTPQTGVAISTPSTSNSITVSGVNTATPISISGGEYRIDSGSFTSSAGTVASGQMVTVRVTSSSNCSTLQSATLTIGGVTGTFSVTTEAADTTPNAFSFTTQTNVKENTLRTSNSITVSGINTPAAISVSGHSSSKYSINGGTFTSTPGTVSNGDTVRVQHTSSSQENGLRTTTLTIGGVTGTFTTRTEDD